MDAHRRRRHPSLRSQADARSADPLRHLNARVRARPLSLDDPRWGLPGNADCRCCRLSSRGHHVEDGQSGRLLLYFAAVRLENGQSGCSKNWSDLGGAMGIRTPDLLHAMERRPVHHSPRQVTCDPLELGICPGQTVSVHVSSPRTVTSLVTSHRHGRTHAAGNHSRFRISMTRLACPPARPAWHSGGPAITAVQASPLAPGRPSSRALPQGLSARASQGPGGAQCTPERTDRTAGVRAPGAPAEHAPAGPPAAGDRARPTGRPT
jgi:hypothetical protein